MKYTTIKLDEENKSRFTSKSFVSGTIRFLVLLASMLATYFFWDSLVILSEQHIVSKAQFTGNLIPYKVMDNDFDQRSYGVGIVTLTGVFVSVPICFFFSEYNAPIHVAEWCVGYSLSLMFTLTLQLHQTLLHVSKLIKENAPIDQLCSNGFCQAQRIGNQEDLKMVVQNCYSKFALQIETNETSIFKPRLNFFRGHLRRHANFTGEQFLKDDSHPKFNITDEEIEKIVNECGNSADKAVQLCKQKIMQHYTIIERFWLDAFENVGGPAETPAPNQQYYYNVKNSRPFSYLEPNSGPIDPILEFIKKMINLYNDLADAFFVMCAEIDYLINMFACYAPDVLFVFLLALLSVVLYIIDKSKRR